jgi:hypothetical protein
MRLNLIWFQRPGDVVGFLAEVAPQAVVRAAA